MAPQLRTNGQEEVMPVVRRRRGRQRAIRSGAATGGGITTLNKVNWTPEQRQYMTAGYQFAAHIAKIHGLVLPTEMPFTTRT
jgi:hypothetical protein